jgi:hypothetical protein
LAAALAPPPAAGAAAAAGAAEAYFPGLAMMSFIFSASLKVISCIEPRFFRMLKPGHQGSTSLQKNKEKGL